MIGALLLVHFSNVPHVLSLLTLNELSQTTFEFEILIFFLTLFFVTPEWYRHLLGNHWTNKKIKD